MPQYKYLSLIHISTPRGKDLPLRLLLLRGPNSHRESYRLRTCLLYTSAPQESAQSFRVLRDFSKIVHRGTSFTNCPRFCRGV